jgi:hypothetical protein
LLKKLIINLIYTIILSSVLIFLMKQYYKLYLTFLLITGLNWLICAQSVHPVTVNLTIAPPYTTNLSDYIGNGAYRTQVFITLNDLNEVVWDTRLKITIEGNGIKMFTRPDFRPAQPFVIYRDQANVLDGNQLDEYFNTTNTVIEGGTRGDIFSNNKLQEGYYTICIEVLDYATGKLLSNKSCAYVQMTLPNVPILLTPRCGSVVSTKSIQQILFSWNPTQSINGLQGSVPEYQLKLYEITSKNIDPLYAIQNGKTLQVFESDWIKTTNYLYTNGDPALDAGKQYVFRVQARYDNNEIQLKNNGFSEPCYFYYGYPTGGNIAIIAPQDSFAFRQNDPLIFSWKQPDNLLPAQRLSYEIQLVKIEEGQTAIEAIQSNTSYYTTRYPEIIPYDKFEIQLPIKLDSKSNYAWKVNAYTDNQLIAESKVMFFRGPSLLEKFYAGNHIVTVDQTYNSDFKSLKGKGRISLGNGKVQSVDFSNINLKFTAGNWVLVDGEIIQALTDTSIITLNPKVALNSKSYFHPQYLRLNSDGLSFKGYIHWPFSHATEESALAKTYSESAWFNYNDFTLIGNVRLTSNNQYNLLEPLGYRMELTPFSEFIVYKNEYKIRFHGDIICPEIINSAATTGGKVRLPFQNAEQLFYFTNNGLMPASGILPVRNIQLHVNPINYTIDLSETQSPGKVNDKADWKGIYFHQSDLNFLPSFDKLGQMNFINDTHYNLEPSNADSNVHYLDAEGQTFRFIKRFDEGYNVKFNTFPAFVNNLRIDIQKSVLENSYLNGNLFIPIISTQKKFSFVCPLTVMGLNPGYMTDLDNYEYTFNPTKEEEKIKIKILRAVFADQEKLDMSLRMEWPFLGISLESISDFYAWGDYHTGFFTKNGTRYLDQQVTGHITDYDYTVTMVSAGRGAGNYAFGFSGNVVIGYDVSGSNGAPVLNLYSTYANSMIPFEEDSWAYTENGTSNNGTTFNPSSSDSPSQQIEIVKKQLEKELKNATDNVQRIAESTSLSEYESKENPSLQLPDTSSLRPDSKEEIKSGLRAKLSDKEYEVLEQFIDEFLRLGANAVTKKTGYYSDKLCTKFNAGLDVPMAKAKAFIDEKVHKIVDTIAIRIANDVFKEEVEYDATATLFIVADTIADELSLEINRSLAASVNNNVRKPVTGFIRAQMVDSVHSLIARRFRTRVHELMEGKVSIEQFTTDVLNEIPDFLGRAGESTLKFISPRNVTSMVQKTTLDAIKGIDLVRVGDRLAGGIFKNSKLIVANTMEGMAEANLNRLVQNVFSNTPILNAVAPPAIQMNFNNLGQKIKEGRVDQIVTLDPTNIAVNTKFVSFAGTLRHLKDTVYGNAWRGAFTVTIKQPKPFGVDAVFLSGKKNGEEFWFCQVSPSDPKAKTGGKLDKNPKVFTTPAIVGPIEIVAGTGRVYKHMKEINRGTDIIPDPTIKYGAFFNLVMFDAANHGKTARIQVEAEYILTDSGAFTVEFDGNVQVISNTVKINQPDMTALVNGNLHLYYNSAEEHFLADGSVSINKPGTVCGGGSFLLETKPGFWRVGVGSKDIPVKVIPACNSWGAMGWLYVDQRYVEIGAGIGFYAKAEGKFDIGPISGGVGIDAGVELKAWVAIQYNPKFALNEVGVQARGWVHIYAFYQFKKDSGTIDLVDIEIGLEGVVHINPKPTYVDGRVWGHIKVLIFGIDFDAGFRKEV